MWWNVLIAISQSCRIALAQTAVIIMTEWFLCQKRAKVFEVTKIIKVPEDSLGFNVGFFTLVHF